MLISLFYTLILSYILFSISKEDIKSMLISEYKLRILLVSGIFYLLCLGLSNKEINTIKLIISNVLSLLIIFLIMYSIKNLGFIFFKKNLLGLGDIKLTSYSSIWLGIEFSFISICISFLLSAIYSLHGKVTRKFKPFHQYPFAPFLSIGIYCSWLLDKI